METLEVVKSDVTKGWSLVKCDNCGIEFLCQNFRIKKHKNLFCCKKCEGNYKKSQSLLNCTCDYCGKKFHRKQSHVDKNKKWNVCSQQCNIEIRRIKMAGENNHQYQLRGALNASWKSDEKVSNYGYKLIRSLDHPFKNCDDFVFEHRLIAEQYLLTNENSIEIDGKRYLSPDFIVHHIDFNRLNNAVDNLKVMKLDEHTRFHVLYKKWKNKEIPKESDKYLELKELVEKYDMTHYINTDDDITEGVRNGGFGSTDKS